MRYVPLPIVLSFGLMLTACGDEEPEGRPATEPVLSAIQADILTPSCTFASCHGESGQKGELILVEGQSFANLIDVPADFPAAAAAGLVRVVPGDPEASFFFQKLAGTHASDHGDAMPQGTAGIEAERLAVIETWIRDGAADN